MGVELIYVKDSGRTLFRINLLLKLSRESKMNATLMVTDNFVGEEVSEQSDIESEEIDAREIKRSAEFCVKENEVSVMRTKIFVSAISLLAALGLSSCYTEFAATGNDEGYGYPSYSSGYYDSSYAGNGYDTTGAPIINNIQL